MNGLDHYREAERLLAQARRDVSLNIETQTGERKADILAAAQAHATLAGAALAYFGGYEDPTEDFARPPSPTPPIESEPPMPTWEPRRAPADPREPGDAERKDR